MRPTESSSTEEIESYKPTGFAGSYFWFYERERLLRLKEMQSSWKKWAR